MNSIHESFEIPRKRAGMGTKQNQRRFTYLCFAISVSLCTSLARAENTPAEATVKGHSSVSAANLFDVTVACVRIVVPDKIIFITSLSRSSPRRQPLDNFGQWLQPVRATLGEGIDFVSAGVEQSNRFGAYRQVAASVIWLADDFNQPQ